MTRSELIEIIYAMQQNEKTLIAEKEAQDKAAGINPEVKAKEDE